MARRRVASAHQLLRTPLTRSAEASDLRRSLLLLPQRRIDHEHISAHARGCCHYSGRLGHDPPLPDAYRAALLRLILVAAAAFLAGVDILPKGVKPSGFAGFDIFNLLVSIGKKQASGIGFLIMAAGGFAAYMERIGAANALVRITVSRFGN